MDENVVKTLIAAAGVVAGAILTALASAYSARQKIRAIELQYEQRLHENYLATARQYSSAVYVPISIQLEGLRRGYEGFRVSVDFDSECADEAAMELFRTCIDEYLSGIRTLMDRGADAFLTNALEEQLRSFTSFVDSSRDATEVARRAVLGYSMSLAGFFATADSVERKLSGRAARLFGTPGFSVSLGGIGFEYNAAAVLSAPLCTRAFEKELLTTVAKLKYLIKEVTLGAQSPPHAG